jgi:hypothetical protein
MRKLFLLALAIISIITACTKIESTTIGNGLIPPIDGVTTFDSTYAVTTTTIIDTSLPWVYKTDDHVVGLTNDPVFGTTNASSFFEMKPTSYKYAFPFKTDVRKDSAVLILNYAGVYGDTSTNPSIKLNVYEIALADSLKGDSVYKVNVNPGLGSLLGSKTFNVKSFRDSFKSNLDSGIANIRIPLDPAFASRLIEQYDSGHQYADDPSFRRAFAGFAVVAQAGSSNILVRFNLTGADTKLALYYHRDSSGVAKDNSVNYFRFSNGAVVPISAAANRVVRNYAGTEVAAAVANPGSTDKVYVQTAPGTVVTIDIPALKTLSNRIIHRAELIAEEDPDASVNRKNFPPPAYLLLHRFNTALNVKSNLLNDYLYEPASFSSNVSDFGGYLTYKNITGIADPVASYSFNISRYVQGIVTRKDTSFPLRIYAPSNDSIRYYYPYPNNTISQVAPIVTSTANKTAEGRVRLGGGTNPRVRMRLRIIFSRI